MLSAYERALTAWPVPTKMATSATIMTCGDITAQFIEIVKEERDSTATMTTLSFDPHRALGMAVFGCFYGGCYQHALFQWYGRTWPVSLAAPWRQRLPNVMRTVAFHQLVNYPLVFFPAFFATTELVRGHSMSHAAASFGEHAPGLYAKGVVLWVPAMVGQFLFVPLRLQVLWISIFSFCWGTFMSFVALGTS